MPGKLNDWWRRLIGQARQPVAPALEGQDVVTVTESEVIYARRDGTVERIAWAALATVEVETEDGPMGKQIWFLLHADAQMIRVLQGGLGGVSLLAHLQELPDWDNDAIRTAMKSPTPYRCRCWTKENKGWQPRRKR